MARKYNSADFRQMAMVRKTWHDDMTAEMLLEAADLLDELEREKKYDYSIKAPNGNIETCHEDEMFQIMPRICTGFENVEG